MSDGERMEAGAVLVVGLGNPGEKYRFNRHNVGFLFLDHLASELFPGGWNGRSKFGGELMDTRFAGRRLYLFKPLSFMNLSGGPTSRVAGFFNVPPGRVVVCYDEASLAFGSLRIRARGSAGGQNGMKDILKALGTQGVPRMRFGVGGRRGRRDLADFVLSDFSKSEQRELPGFFSHCTSALDAMLREGPTQASSKYNLTVKLEEEVAS